MKIYYNEGNKFFYFQEDSDVILCNDYGTWYKSLYRAEEIEYFSSVFNDDNEDIILICEVTDE